MKISIITIDNMVIINSVPCAFDFSSLIDSNIHALQWDGTSGHVEYISHIKPNKKIKNITAFQPIIDAYYTAIEEQKTAIAQAKADKIATMTYQEKRVAEYPPISTQLDVLWEVIDVPAGSKAEMIKAEIQTVKDKYPKLQG